MEGLREEIWKELPARQKYLVSSHGRIMILNFKNSGINRHASIRTMTWGRWSGYKSTSINGKAQLIHRLVAETFLPNPNCLGYVNHKDSDRGNNHVDNLEWCTQSYNCKHSYYTGTNPIEKKMGINNGRARFDELQVRVIKSLMGQLTQVQIAKYFKREQTIISCIHLGKTWAHI